MGNQYPHAFVGLGGLWDWCSDCGEHHLAPVHIKTTDEDDLMIHEVPD